MKFELTREEFNELMTIDKDLLTFSFNGGYFYECHYFSQMKENDFGIDLPYNVFYNEGEYNRYEGTTELFPKTYEEIKPVIEDYINKRIKWIQDGKEKIGSGWDGEQWIEIWN